MTYWQIAIQSLKHYWRSNFAIVLGVAAATAVLTGALIVGDSMRNSLRELSLDRLGSIDEMIVSDGFFRAALAEEVAALPEFSAYEKSVPGILFPNGTVESRREEKTTRATNVNVIGVSPEFWSLGEGLENIDLHDRNIVINKALADLLVGSDGSNATRLTLRIPKPTQLPSDSALGKTDDLIESIPNLNVVATIDNKSLGRFGLHPSQIDSPNIYVPIELLQDSLSRTTLKHKSDPAVANVIFLVGKDSRIPSVENSTALKGALRPTLEDFGLTLKRVTQKAPDETVVFDYWSLSSDRLVLHDDAVRSIEGAFPEADPVFTYLANEIRAEDQRKEDCGIPFSMVAAIDFGKTLRLISAIDEEPLGPLADDEIVLNQWAADSFSAEIGEEITLVYFEPETTHGNQVERSATFKLAGIAKLTKPESPFVVNRRVNQRATYLSEPTLANDPDLTPEVPGVTDAETIDNWDLPFDTKDKIRPEDDDYWNFYRTTPKAFISLAAGQRLWNSRFGQTTSFRIPRTSFSAPTDGESEATLIGNRILDQFVADKTRLGFQLVPIKRNVIAASSGSTPFDALFLALSMFVILSALILVSLLFRLALQGRASEIGLLQAVGFQQKAVLGTWLREMLIVCGIGAAIGILLGIGYAWLLVLGLTTWWVGAISSPIIELHIGPLSLMVGFLSGLSICVATIWWSLKRTHKQATTSLLSGQLESSNENKVAEKQRGWLFWLALVLLIVAVGLSGMATQLVGDAQAGAFMGSGFMILAALLLFVFRWLESREPGSETTSLGLTQLAMMSLKRNPLRSTLTIGLVAVASFLIAAVSSFRLAPTDAGTAGFDWVARSSAPVFADLNTEEGQAEALGKEYRLPAETRILSLRLKPGEDASCNNLYQSTKPQVLGVPSSFVEHFDSKESVAFGWGSNLAETELEQENPWQLLSENSATTNILEEYPNAIPCVIDKNTANYSLKIFATGGVFSVEYDSGETVDFHVVGFLTNTILQGSLIVSEENFVKAFPTVSGYRYFLIEDGVAQSSVETLEDRLGDQGFDAQSAPKILSNFMKVQNTYLSTFQALGALGLFLGTFGLGAVQMRNVVERKQELGLFRAVGYSLGKLARMVLVENGVLLLLGMSIGIISAICSTLPHYFAGSASMPWIQLAAMFAAIVLVGLLAGLLAARLIGRLPLLESLRA